MESPDDSARTITTEVSISGGDWELRGRMTVPAGPVRIGELLPLARALSDAIVGETIKGVEQLSESISCRKGCGACCRQLVAISEVEARRLRQVVEEMPEPRRSRILARFADARSKLSEAGLLPHLDRANKLTDNEYTSLAMSYFGEHIACPFLEDESCSIYNERPITCREYLVVSPAENCSRPTADNIRRVKMPLRVFNAVARWQVPPSDHFLERWVPLILALDWAEAHPEDPPPQPGRELLRELLNNLAVKETEDDAEQEPG
jgi:Fe-S-cluster containining protein